MSSFAQDLYDVLGMNTDQITQKEFFAQYVADDKSFMIDSYRDKDIIYFDHYRIVVLPND